MQESPRQMRASMKLGPSFLIHAKTSKGVNSAIGRPYGVFYGFRTRFVRVWRPLMAILYLKEVVRVFDPRHECVGSILGTKACVCTCKKEGRFEFLFLFGL